MSTWTGLLRVATADKVHVYGVQNIVLGEVRDVHVARLRFDADGSLEVTADFIEIFQHTPTQGNFGMAGIIVIAEVEERVGFDIRVDWVGFEKESSWEPLKTI